MGFDRRTLLGALGAGIGLKTVVERATGQTQEGQSGNQTESDLAGRTEQIMDELRWFATDYPTAIEEFRAASESVLNTVSAQGETIQLTESAVERLDGEIDRPRLDRGWPYDIWWDEGERRWRYVDIDWQRPTDELTDETPLSAERISDLRESTADFLDTFESELDPYFYGLAQEQAFATNTLDTIAEFNDHGDIAMVVAGLVRLYQHYQALSTVSYVESAFSETPITNRLAEYLESPIENTTVPLFEVDYRQRGGPGHRAYVYQKSVGEGRRAELNRAEPLETIDGSAGGSGGLRLHDVVGELAVDTGRVDRCYVLVNEWTRPSSSYYTEPLPSQSVFVQRYESEAQARQVREELLSRSDIMAAVNVNVRLGESGTPFWTPIYFPYRQAPWSGALRQTGRHLLVAGVSRRPFQHRTRGIVGEEWARPLELSWVWSMGE
jgi:hypothetical protein